MDSKIKRVGKKTDAKSYRFNKVHLESAKKTTGIENDQELMDAILEELFYMVSPKPIIFSKPTPESYDAPKTNMAVADELVFSAPKKELSILELIQLKKQEQSKTKKS